jgi:hypothetical protein
MTGNYNLGDNEYNQSIETELKQQADLIVNNLKKNYDDIKNTISGQLDIYNGLFVNFKNVVELDNTYKMENDKLFKQFKENTHDILTNERKTYYEDQQNDVLNNYYYYILWIIYIIVVLCIIVFSLIYPSQSSWTTKMGLVILFLVLPFVSSWLLGKIIYIVYWLFNLLPKNVYK